jgi:hypothetical protein
LASSPTFFIRLIGEDVNQLPNHYKFDDICWIGEDANQLTIPYKFDDIFWIGEDANQLPIDALTVD